MEIMELFKAYGPDGFIVGVLIYLILYSEIKIELKFKGLKKKDKKMDLIE
ncbi:MAG: hypothetical protein Q7U04_13805 [Bacteriovorax sp.]|nr:hypothetical protein [Bacteriovorax sp.]